MFVEMKLLLFGDTGRLGGLLHCALGHGEVCVNGDLGYGDVVVCEVDVGGAARFFWGNVDSLRNLTTSTSSTQQHPYPLIAFSTIHE